MDEATLAGIEQEPEQPRDWRSEPEKRLIDRRCRCGRPAAETGKGCKWHESVAAEYARDLSAALAEQQRENALWRERTEVAREECRAANVGAEAAEAALADLRAKVAALCDSFDPASGSGRARAFVGDLRAALAAAPSGEPKTCPDCESDDRNMRGIVPVPSGGRWGYREQECESEWHDSSAAPSGEQRKEGQR